MLEKTRIKLQSFYDAEDQQGTDGKRYRLDGHTLTSRAQAGFLAALHEKVRPQTSLEVGFAYGFSAMSLLDRMHELDYGRHVAIDCYQFEFYQGIGLQAVKDLGFESRFSLMAERSDFALAGLAQRGERFQYIYIDGGHRFDDCLIDFMLADRILDVGGVIVIDDMWMPSIRMVVRFIRANMANYTELTSGIDNIVCLEKTGPDTRRWDHYVDFSLPRPKPTMAALLKGLRRAAAR